VQENEFLYDEEITKQVEQDKLQQIYRASNNLKRNLAKLGRCPVCTLAPPCKHQDKHGSSYQPRNSSIDYVTQNSAMRQDSLFTDLQMNSHRDGQQTIDTARMPFGKLPKNLKPMASVTYENG